MISKTADKSVNPPSDRSLWLWSPGWDLVVGCGLWTLPWLAAAAFLPDRGILTGALIFQALCLVCNNPHYAATIFRAYSSAESIREHRLYTVYGTGLILLGGVVAVVYPVLIPWIFTIYLTWSPFHYTGQNYGIGAMFQGRAGCPPDRLEKTLLKWGFLASFGLWVLGAHSGISNHASFVSLEIPPDWAFPLRIVLLAVFVGLLGTSLFSLVQRYGFLKCGPLLAMSLTQTLWFAVPAAVQLGSWSDSVPPAYFSSGALAFMHCAQYLWITGYTARKHAEEQGQDISAGRSRYFLRYLGPLVLAGMALFVPGPWILSRLGGLDFVQAFLLVTALVNIHHFMIDGVIWKLRDKKIRHELVDTEPEGPPATGLEPGRSATKRGWFLSLPLWARGAGIFLISLSALDLTYHALQQPGMPERSRSLAQVLNPHDGRHELRMAQEHAEAGRWEEAIRLARIAVEKAPQTDAQYLLGTLLLQTGQTTAAMAHYNQQIWQVRPDMTTLINRGILAAKAGHQEESVQLLVRAARLSPQDPEALIQAAEALLGSGRFQESAETFDRALNLVVPQPGEAPKIPAERIVSVAFRSVAAFQGMGQADLAKKRLVEAQSLAHQLGVAVPKIDP